VPGPDRIHPCKSVLGTAISGRTGAQLPSPSVRAVTRLHEGDRYIYPRQMDDRQRRPPTGPPSAALALFKIEPIPFPPPFHSPSHQPWVSSVPLLLSPSFLYHPLQHLPMIGAVAPSTRSVALPASASLHSHRTSPACHGPFRSHGWVRASL